MNSFDALSTWPCSNVAAAAIDADGAIHRWGDCDHVFELASVTKLLTAAAVHLAVEEGSISLEDVVGTRDATIADVLAHAGGYAADGTELTDPGRRRIYSNGGYEHLAGLVTEATEMDFGDYLVEGICRPLGMDATELRGSAAYAGRSTVNDLVRFAQGLDALLAAETIAALATPHLPELIGVLPGYGRQTPNLWGLGPEIRGAKSPHWTGASNSEATWGHFGQAGTFLWIDPVPNVTLICLTDTSFGDWAIPRWPAFSDDVLAELAVR